MANDRAFLACEEHKERLLLSKHTSSGWAFTELWPDKRLLIEFLEKHEYCEVCFFTEKDMDEYIWEEYHYFKNYPGRRK